MSIGLTKQQDALLTFLTERQRAGGAMPSVEEMAQGIGVRSKGGIHRMLDALVERGRIRKLKNRARAIEVVGHNVPTTFDEATERALAAYCYVTGIMRNRVIADAVRDWLRRHPSPPAPRSGQ